MSWYPQNSYGDPNSRRPYPVPPASSRTWVSPALAAASAANNSTLSTSSSTPPPTIPAVASIQYNQLPRPSPGSGLFKNRTLVVNHSNAVASGSSTPMMTDEEEGSASESKIVHVQQNLFRGKQGTLVSGEKLKEQLLARKAKLELEKVEQEKLDSVRAVRRSTRGRGASRGRGRGARPVTVVRTAPAAASTELCRFFTKTGECSKALTCRYVHDDSKMSLCPLFLTKRCPHTTTTCRLSHTPSPSNSPQCKHHPLCRSSSCPYSHSNVDRDTMLCKEFAEKGWCDKGSDCEERHSAGCWEFSKLGTCTTKGCKGPHILMRKETKEKETKEKLDEGAGVRWMEDFLGDLKPEMISERKRKAIDDGGRDGFLNQDTFQSFEVEYSDEEEEEEDEVEIIETESEIIEIPLSEDEMETIPLTRPARPVQQYNDEEELDYGIDEIRALSDGEEESDEEVISSLLVH